MTGFWKWYTGEAGVLLWVVAAHKKHGSLHLGQEHLRAAPGSKMCVEQIDGCVANRLNVLWPTQFSPSMCSLPHPLLDQAPPRLFFVCPASLHSHRSGGCGQRHQSAAWWRGGGSTDGPK